MCNCSRAKFEAIIVIVFLCKIFARPFLRFCSRTFFEFPSDFLHFSPFLNDLNCSLSEVKFVAKVKAIVA